MDALVAMYQGVGRSRDWTNRGNRAFNSKDHVNLLKHTNITSSCCCWKWRQWYSVLVWSHDSQRLITRFLANPQLYSTHTHTHANLQWQDNHQGCSNKNICHMQINSRTAPFVTQKQTGSRKRRLESMTVKNKSTRRQDSQSRCLFYSLSTLHVVQ